MIDPTGALQRLGLSKYEAETFVALQQIDSGTASDVAELADVPRSQVYGAAEDLEDRGLLSTQCPRMREAAVTIANSALDKMGLEELFAVIQEAGLMEFEELACRGRGAVIQTKLEQRCDEQALADIAYVDQWHHVAERKESHVYVISFTAPGLPSSLETTAADLVGACDPDVDERGATMSLVGPHEAISGHLSEYQAAGVSLTLEHIGGYDGRDSPLKELTNRQREVIETAWNMGYYEVPKQVSADEVADEVGLDSSTVIEHLQRAERNLLDQIL